jgi:mono/diheme cytochrome c family protein
LFGSSLAAVVLSGVIYAAADGRTTWDGVYTEAQAKRGEQLYAAKCSRCHTDTLVGDGTATALTGTGFTANWDGVSLGELAERTRTTMPDDEPGKLSRQQVADVIAFVLKFNKFPAGDTELPSQIEALGLIKYVATKKGT